ncbi:MAG: methyltransferase domain-containing protein [Verrucomicrobiaceae bacterium]|nr:MAG: methyltransferase domain-containing protein [Verrucomicrobiaceae bacterium]
MSSATSPSPPALTQCPGCGGSSLGGSLFLAAQPVILNYRFGSAQEAQNVPRRDLHLRECNSCGLVFNAILDAAAIPYDERYENRQNFSAGFLGMLRDTADSLTGKYLAGGGTVLEVGCGKGDFLQILCRRAQAQGLGYDTSCEHPGPTEDGRITFFQRYVTPEDVAGKLDLIICRHVVEHVPQIGDFMRLLHGISEAGGGAPVYIETPALEWIVEHQAFWDVFYEHCNYFPVNNLRRLAELAGFEVLDHRLIFGGQYQALEIRPAPGGKTAHPGQEPVPGQLETLSGALSASRREVTEKLAQAGAAGGWAIWGAGAKGVSLGNALTDSPPAFVIDSNPSKQGMFLPGTGIRVIAPESPEVKTIPVILVANSNYLPEISATLASLGCQPKLLPL